MPTPVYILSTHNVSHTKQTPYKSFQCTTLVNSLLCTHLVFNVVGEMSAKFLVFLLYLKITFKNSRKQSQDPEKYREIVANGMKNGISLRISSNDIIHGILSFQIFKNTPKQKNPISTHFSINLNMNSFHLGPPKTKGLLSYYIWPKATSFS